MVCKEDLCKWFQNLNPRKRIEYMCALLHMCLPLELRFLGTVLEDYGKKDYHYLRDGEIKANSPTEIAKYRDLPAEYLRAKMFTSLALLHSANTACAQAIFDTIENNLGGAFGPCDDNQVMEDILTIFALAANHPAFLFEQKRRLYDHIQRLDNHRRDIFRDNADNDDPSLDLFPGARPQYHTDDGLHFSQLPLCNRHSPVQQPRKICIQNIEVKGSRKAGDRSRDGELFCIHVTWSNGEITEVDKRFKEVQEFYRQLIDLFPDESPKVHGGRIPNFLVPNHQQHAEQFNFLAVFLRALPGLPRHILECDHMTQFFKGNLVQAAPVIPAFPPSVPYQTICSMPHDANRIPRWTSFPHPYFAVSGAPQRFPASHTCPYQSAPHHLLPQRPSPSSPPSPPSSATSSPNNSRPSSPAPQAAVPDTATSVTQLLKLLGLEKYAGVLGGYSVEQLMALNGDEMNKLGLPREAQTTLHSKLDQITSEKPVMINGLIDNAGYPSSSASPASPSALAWLPLSPGGGLAYIPYRPCMPASPRSMLSAADSSPAPSDVASPPPSPGPAQSLPGKLHSGDTSDGSEDTDRADKNEAGADSGKGTVYYSKSAQVKVSPAGGRGGAGSPQAAAVAARMTPPEDPAKGPIVHPQPGIPPALIPMYAHIHHPHHLHAQSLHSQYMEPKGEMNLMGVAGGAHNMNSNTNNNNYTSESGPIMSTGVPLRQPLLQAGVGATAVRAPFKAGQPQPAHTNMPGVLQGKNLITMPADPKPGSPIMPYVPLRPQDMQAQMAQGIVTSSTPTMESAGVAQRLPMYHLPLGRGQGGPITTPLPPGHQAQNVIPYSALITRSVSTTMSGSAAAMTVSAAHMVTTVTASHVSAPNTSSSQRSPSHSGSGSQRDSVTELGGNDAGLRSSPVQGGSSSVGAAPSPPAMAQHVPCQVCNQVPAVPMYPAYQPYWPANGLLPQAAMSSFYAQGQPLATGVLTNGFATPDMYNYSHPSFPAVGPSGHIHPMLYGNSLYQGVHPQQNANPPTVSAGGGGGSASGAPAQAAPAGAMAVSVSQGVTVASKPRKDGCYNCGSSSHKPSECQENSMESMSGHYHLNFKPRTDSD